MTVTPAIVAEWIAAYERAWDSNESADIRALFTDDARYLTAPFATPRVGIEAIISGWLEDRDEAGDHAFRWNLTGIDGDTAFIDGVTDYVQPARVYSNLWVIAFADDGRATSYTEWYMRYPEAKP
jgi:hypothetical protein